MCHLWCEWCLRNEPVEGMRVAIPKKDRWFCGGSRSREAMCVPVCLSPPYSLAVTVMDRWICIVFSFFFFFRQLDWIMFVFAFIFLFRDSISPDRERSATVHIFFFVPNYMNFTPASFVRPLIFQILATFFPLCVCCRWCESVLSAPVVPVLLYCLKHWLVGL